MNEIARLLILSVIGAGMMLSIQGKYLTQSKYDALATVVVTGFCLYTMLRRLGYRAY